MLIIVVVIVEEVGVEDVFGIRFLGIVVLLYLFLLDWDVIVLIFFVCG